MNRSRIMNAVSIIDYAIKCNISVSEASIKNGFARSYVKNIKAIVYEKYDNDTLDDELFTLFNEAYQKYESSRGVNKEDEKNYSYNKDIISSGGKTKLDVKGNDATVEWVSGSNYPHNHVKTLEDLLKSCNVDENIWSVKDHLINKWDTTSWKNGKPQTIENFQVKAKLERIIENIRIASAAEVFLDMVKDYEAPVLGWTPITTPKRKENNLLEVSIFDLHIGKLSWGGETGENYDTKIACKRFMYSIEKLLARASGFDFSRILFPVGSDFFNSDTILNTTTKGTPQDEDLRWQKTFRLGVNLLIDGIEILKQTGVPVDVVVVSGNHDYERSFYMGEFLAAWYKNDPLVNIDNGASSRKYYVFGEVLIGFTHGSEEKESSLPLIMANDIASKPYWSQTKFHEWHVGHIHRKRNIKYSVVDTKERELNEDLGVTIRYLSSLTGTDGWHHTRGFIGQIKAADAFIWNDKLGYVAHLNSNIIIEKYKE